MSSIFIPIQHHYRLLLATFKKNNGQTAFKGDGTPILNSVRDVNIGEVHENSIGVLQIGASQCTAWVVAVPKQLTISNEEVLCFVVTCGPSFMHPFVDSSIFF